MYFHVSVLLPQMCSTEYMIHVYLCASVEDEKCAQEVFAVELYLPLFES